MVLRNSNLNVTIKSASETLALTGGLSAGGNNVTVTSPLEGNWWDHPTQRPGGTLMVNTAPVTGIGTLALNYVNVNITGVTVEAQAVTGGTSFLFLNGASLVRPGSGTNPSVDVLKFDLSGGSTYTAGIGTTVRTSVLTSADNTGVFTLNGGTLAINPSNGTGFIGYDIDTNAAMPLAAFYLGANGGTIDCGNQWVGIGNSLTNAPGVTMSGPLTVTDGGALSDGQHAYFNGGTFINGGGCVYGGVVDVLGTGPIDVSGGGSLTFGGGAAGQVTNAIVLHGPGKSNGAYTALHLDWNAGAVEFVGSITVNNSTNTTGDPTTFSDIANQHFGSALTIACPITGPGGLLFGNPMEAPNGGVTLSQITIAGTVPNSYQDATYVTGQFVMLAKDSTSGTGTNTAAAIPGDLHLAPAVNGAANAIGSVGLLADNQTSVNTVVHFDSPSWPANGMWAEFSLGGRTDTVRGLTTAVSDGLNAVCNSSYSASVCPKNVYPVPTTVGTLTIMTQSGDDFTYAGVIKDDLVSTAGVPALALVKDGPGTQRFVINTSLGGPTGWGAAAMFTYTGGTTVKAGLLDISAVGHFTPGSPIILQGGTLLAGNLLSGPITRGATTSGTLEAGGATFTSLTLTGAVDIGATTVDAGQTLVIAPTVPAVPDVIDSVTRTGTVQVAGGATLHSTRINVDTLIVGGTAIVTPMTSAAGVTGMPSLTAVPEPSTLVLLVLAGMGALLAWRRK